MKRLKVAIRVAVSGATFGGPYLGISKMEMTIR